MRFYTKEIIAPRTRDVALQPMVNVAVAKGGVALLQEIKAQLEPHNKTGKVSGSWQIKPIPDGVVVFTDYKPAVYLNYGTGKYRTGGQEYAIRPRASRSASGLEGFLRGKGLTSRFASRYKPGKGSRGRSALMFDDDGQRFVVDHVTHPGIKGILYVEKALATAMPDIEAAIADAAYEYVTEELGIGVGMFTRSGKAATGVFKSGPRAGQAFARGAGGRFTG